MPYQYKREPLSDDEVNRLTNTFDAFGETLAAVSRTFSQDIFSSFGNKELIFDIETWEIVFFEPKSARIWADTEKTSNKFMTSENATLLYP